MVGVLLPLLVVCAGPASAAPAASSGPAGPVVLVGVPGLSWSDVSQDNTPALWSLLEDGAVGTLADQGVRATAIGPRPGIALADSSGQVIGQYQRRPVRDSDLEALVGDSVASSDLVVVNAGALADTSGTDPNRYEQAAVLDDRVRAVLDGAGRTATVVVAALADSGQTPRLDLLAVRGALDGRPASGQLWSASTRQAGIAQALDLTPTLVELLDLPGPSDLVRARATSRYARHCAHCGEVRTADPMKEVTGHLPDAHSGPEQVDGHRRLDPPAGCQR